AQKFDLHPGDRVRLVPSTPFGGFVPGPHFEIPVEVVGIGASPGMFQPLSGGYVPGVNLTPAFYRANPRIVDPKEGSAAVRLEPGVSIVTFRAHLAELNRSTHGGLGIEFSQPQQTAGVQQATRTQAISLWALAILLAIAGLAIFSQALARQAFLESVEYPRLRAIGVSPRQLWAVGTIRACVIGIVGATVATGVGLALSPLFPVGIARIAEPHPGFALDVPV